MPDESGSGNHCQQAATFAGGEFAVLQPSRRGSPRKRSRPSPAILPRQFASATQTAADKSSDPKLVVAANGLAAECKRSGCITRYCQGSSDRAGDHLGRFSGESERRPIPLLHQGDWTAGLLHLAKGSDLRLKRLAAGSLRTPTDTSAQVALADGWAEAAEFEPGLAKTANASGEPTLGISQPRRTSPGMKRIRAEARLKRILAADPEAASVRHEQSSTEPATNARPPSRQTTVDRESPLGRRQQLV